MIFGKPLRRDQPSTKRVEARDQSTDHVGHSALSSGVGIYVSALLVVAAGIFRFYASLGDFWMDEIWTWMMLVRLESAWDILFSLCHDNNHFLNSWVVYIFGPDTHWILYRVPAVMAGTGSVVLAGLIARTRGVLESFTAMMLIGGSYVCIHYSSEARGYAYVVFFSLLSFWLLGQWLERRRQFDLGLFWLSAALGILSHLSFFHCYLGLVVWSVVRLVRSGRWLAAVTCHFPLMLLAVCLYFVNWRDMSIGGGTVVPTGEVIRQTLALSVGGPQWGWLSAIAIAAAIIGLLLGLFLFWRAKSDLWLLYFTIVVVAPAVSLVLISRDDVYVRYFLVSIVFLLLLYSIGLGYLYRTGSVGRVAYCLILVLVIAGNAVQTERLIRLGRGTYLEALREIERVSEPPLITIGSDHDARNRMVIEYYRLYLSDPERIRYVSQEEVLREGVDWYIRHSQVVAETPDEVFFDDWGNSYRLMRQHRFAGLSGWNWFVYRIE